MTSKELKKIVLEETDWTWAEVKQALISLVVLEEIRRQIEFNRSKSK
jgi:hypothetical protein